MCAAFPRRSSTGYKEQNSSQHPHLWLPCNWAGTDQKGTPGIFFLSGSEPDRKYNHPTCDRGDAGAWGYRSRGVCSPAGSVRLVSCRALARRRLGSGGKWWLGSRTLVFRRSRSCSHMRYGLGGKNGRERSRKSCRTMPQTPSTTHTVIMTKSNGGGKRQDS